MAEQDDNDSQEAGETLSAKERAFVTEYLVDRNGTQAAIRAGYAAPSAHVAASRLLRKDKVRLAIAAGEQRAQERAELTLDDVIAEFRLVAFAKQPEFKTWGPNGVKAKVEALKSLGQHLGMFTSADERKLRRALDELLVQVKPHMKPESYAEFVAALGEEMGLPELGEGAAPSGAVGAEPPVH